MVATAPMPAANILLWDFLTHLRSFIFNQYITHSSAAPLEVYRSRARHGQRKKPVTFAHGI